MKPAPEYLAQQQQFKGLWFPPPGPYSNWIDPYLYPVLKITVPLLARFNFITPNLVTIISFIVYGAGCFFVTTDFAFSPYLAAILLFLGYLLDCVDGELARYKGLQSTLGDYLDKVLDTFKIAIIHLSIGFKVFMDTQNLLFLILAFISASCFYCRYYIKWVSVVVEASKDKEYLEKCSRIKKEVVEKINTNYVEMARTFSGKLKILWLRSKNFIFFDEAELVVLAIIGVLSNALSVTILILVIGQVGNLFFRAIQRGYQLDRRDPELLMPMRK